ncbi:hypothetical protein T492DRAFT_964275, partial [Pavlovales sp. CCMP2436]
MWAARRTAANFVEVVGAGALRGVVAQQTVDSVMLDMLPPADSAAWLCAPAAPAAAALGAAGSAGGAALCAAAARRRAGFRLAGAPAHRIRAWRGQQRECLGLGGRARRREQRGGCRRGGGGRGCCRGAASPRAARDYPRRAPRAAALVAARLLRAGALLAAEAAQAALRLGRAPCRAHAHDRGECSAGRAARRAWTAARPGGGAAGYVRDGGGVPRGRACVGRSAG